MYSSEVSHSTKNEFSSCAFVVFETSSDYVVEM